MKKIIFSIFALMISGALMADEWLLAPDVSVQQTEPDPPKVRLTYQGFPYKRTSCEYPSFYIGALVRLSKTQPMNEEGQVLTGWLYNGETYLPGAAFTMPEEDVELVPVWGEQGIENTEHRAQNTEYRKELRDGQLVIVREGVEYNMMGGRVQ